MTGTVRRFGQTGGFYLRLYPSFRKLALVVTLAGLFPLMIAAPAQAAAVPPVQDGNTVYRMGIPNTGECWDIEGASLSQGARLIRYQCHTGWNQYFKFLPKGTWNGHPIFVIQEQNSGHCLDVKGASRSEGASIIKWGCHQENNQRWIERSRWQAGWGYGYEYISVHSGMCLNANAYHFRQAPCAWENSEVFFESHIRN